MNGYQRREAERNGKRKAHQQAANEARQLQRNVRIHESIRSYEEAAQTVQGRTIKLTHINGWIRVGSTRVRIAELDALTGQIWARQHELDMACPADLD